MKYPDLIDELSILQWAGLCVEKVENVENVKCYYSSKNCFLCRFYKGEAYRLYLSIKKLAESLPAEVERLRFFGKILTRTVPYYIVEGVSPEEEENIVEVILL